MSSVRRLLSAPALLRRGALASLIANAGIVVTGGAVRLTGSGLGCPTWPRCTDGSYGPTPELGIHGAIEFGNRTLTGVVGALAAICLVAALAQRPARRDRVRPAALVLAGVVAQAALGGFTVLTDLNPWVVAAHFLVSAAIIAAAHQLWVRSRGPAVATTSLPRPLIGLAWVTTAVSAAVLAAGTIVTGSGPHAGDAETERMGFDAGQVAQFHTDLVFLLVGLSVALWFALRAVDAPPAAGRAALVLVGVELGQGAIGFVQYFTHLPVLAVGLHMAGACLVWIATLALLAAVRHPVPAQSAATRKTRPPGRPLDRDPEKAPARAATLPAALARPARPAGRG